MSQSSKQQGSKRLAAFRTMYAIRVLALDIRTQGIVGQGWARVNYRGQMYVDTLFDMKGVELENGAYDILYTDDVQFHFEAISKQ